MRKHKINLFVFFSILILLLSSCENAVRISVGKMAKDLPSNITENFSDMRDADEILNEIKGIDLYHIPKFDGLTMETETDDESSTSIDRYFDGEKIVYAVYNGYGEACFDYYTRSKSGKDIIVKYVDMNSERYSVDFDCENYFVSLEELNKNSQFGADRVLIYITEDNAADLPKEVAYELSDGKLSIHGWYFAEDGYRFCGAYPTENEYDIFDDVIYKSVENINSDSWMNQVKNDSRIKFLQTSVGDHKLEYVSDGSAKRWYFIADIAAFFENEKDALDFAKEYGLAPEVIGDNYTVKFKSVTLEISEDFVDFADFARSEINDSYYCSVILDDSGKLLSLERRGGVE